MNKTISTNVIVLRKSAYLESSLIISTISPEYGRVDFVIKGARKITKKAQPIIDLFRELAVEYKESNSLHSPISLDLIEEHDKIALSPKIFSETMAIISFLSKNIHPNIPCDRVYSAFKNLLKKSADGNIKTFDFPLLKLVYLSENGLLPEQLSDSNTDERSQSLFLKKLMDYAEGNSSSQPKLPTEYWNKLGQWITNLCQANDL